MSHPIINPLTGECHRCELTVQKDVSLQCETCNLFFHPLCPATTTQEKLCTKTFLAQFNAKSTCKPNFSWKCNECMITQDTAKKTDLAQIVHSLALKLESLSKSLDDFKQEASQDTLVVTDALDAFRDTFIKHINSNQPPDLQSSSQGNPWANARATQKLRSSFIVKPTTSGAADMVKINKIVSDNKLQVNMVGVSQKGNTFIHCPTKEASATLQTHIQSELAGHVVHSLQDSLPSISIAGITATQWNPLHVTPEGITDFIQKLMDQNPFLHSLITDGETFNVIFMKPPNGVYNNFQIVARVSPKIRDAISAHWNRLFIGATSVRVYDRFYVKRCNKCNKFGHYKDNCTETTSSCGICGVQGHESETCDHKTDTSSFSCINCKRANLTHTGHNATSRKCPAYLIAQKKIKGTIPYYQGIQNTFRPPRQ